MTKYYTIEVVRSRLVEVMAESTKEAQQCVREMYEGGDGCAELGDATYGCVKIKRPGDEDEDEDGDVC